MIKIIKYFFQSIFIYVLFLIAKVLGIKLSRKIFSKLFLIIGPIFRSTKILEKNLKIFLSVVPHEDKKEIIQNMWKNYGMTFVEYIFLNQLHKSSSHITFKGEKILNNVLKNKKPVIFISGHFANFELMSMELTKKKIKLATIYRPLNNFFLNPFMEFLRKKYICSNQIKKGINGVRDAIEYIKKEFSVALMIDQRVSEGEKISFFGKTALTTTLPAQLSIKYNLDIIPIYIERKRENHFLIEFLEPISNKHFKNKIDLSDKLNKVLENMIIKNPKQWIWTHNRWK